VAENSLTVLISSHNLRELEDLCDTIGIMDKGKIILERDLFEMESESNLSLEEIFLNILEGGR
jgi:ABC-2 type transport system ATP-binding protein